MTDLTKPLRRRSRAPFGHYRRRIVVTLEPGDLLAMRLERTRMTYRASLADVFRQLAAWHAVAERRCKADERRQSRTSP